MNAQLNSTNFQQFVCSNQGKLITFLHNDQKISKVVVDIQGEYFTGKTNVSDAKIDGFYYFSDCKMVEVHPLIAVLEKHRFVNLKSFNKYEFVEFISGLSGSFACKPLNEIYPKVIATKLTSDIEEAWTVVDGHYKIVYSKSLQEFRNEISLEDVLSSNKDVTIETTLERFPNFKFQSIKDDVIYGTSNEGTTVFSACINLKNIKRVLSKDGKELYVNIADKENKNEIEDLPDKLTKEKNQYTLIQEHHEKFLQLKDILTIYAPKNVGKFMDSIMTIKNGNFTLDKLLNFKQYWEEVKDEYLPFTTSYKTNPKIQALMKRYAELALLLCPSNEDTKYLIEKIDKIMIVAGKKEYDRLFKNVTPAVVPTVTKNIKYRGKPKTVEVMSEYTHVNGKNYVLVKDVTDNGKTKTLFKEYIEWM
jgi:hypothetical protein